MMRMRGRENREGAAWREGERGEHSKLNVSYEILPS